jgi:hypothetical protein
VANVKSPKGGDLERGDAADAVRSHEDVDGVLATAAISLYDSSSIISTLETPFGAALFPGIDFPPDRSSRADGTHWPTPPAAGSFPNCARHRGRSGRERRDAHRQGPLAQSASCQRDRRCGIRAGRHPRRMETRAGSRGGRDWAGRVAPLGRRDRRRRHARRRPERGRRRPVADCAVGISGCPLCRRRRWSPRLVISEGCWSGAPTSCAHRRFEWQAQKRKTQDDDTS